MKVKQTFHFWDKPYLVMIFYPFYRLFDSAKILFRIFTSIYAHGVCRSVVF